MRYGIRVNTPEWDALMESARDRATLTGERTKIVASENSERATRYQGVKYVYDMLAPEGTGYRRCGVKSPTGKPCLREVLFFGVQHVFHLSRGLAKDTYVSWTYVDMYGHAISRKSDKFHIEEMTEAQAKQRRLL